jgi:hypothetical protein
MLWKLSFGCCRLSESNGLDEPGAHELEKWLSATEIG